MGCPYPTFIAKEGRPPASTTSHHDALLHAISFRQVKQLPRQHGEVETPTSHQSPCVIQTCLPAARGVAKSAGRATHLHQQGIQYPREADDARPPLD